MRHFKKCCEFRYRGIAQLWEIGSTFSNIHLPMRGGEGG